MTIGETAMRAVLPMWLSTNEAAVHTGDDVKTVRNAAESGELLGYQRTPGGRWKFRTEDLDRWVRGESPRKAS